MNLKILPNIDVKLIRSARARQITLRVSSLDGKVSVTAPKHVSTPKIEKFLYQKESWVKWKRSEVPKKLDVTIGSIIPYRGQMLKLVKYAGKNILRSHDKLLIPESKKFVGLITKEFLKQAARKHIKYEAANYSKKIGKCYTKLSLRDTRSRWGSCNGKKALMFSWRLVMAPPEVLSYVAAHEVAHLKHMNHSAQFWEEVMRLYGKHYKARQWLREKGMSLHRYSFYH